MHNFPLKHAITNEITSLKRDFDVTNDGELQDYLGTRFDRSPDGSPTFTQPHMVDHVLDIVGLLSGSNAKIHDTPAIAILNFPLVHVSKNGTIAQQLDVSLTIMP